MSFLMPYLDFREPVSAWSHCLWLVLSLPATLLLWRRSEGDRARRVSLLIFGVSLAICYAGSTLFHAVRLPAIWIDRFDQFDHIGIFILIAGSYTPVAWNCFQGRRRWAILGAAWFFSALGSALLLTCGMFSIFWSTCFYLAMGWGAALCYLEMARALSHRTLFPLLMGGILYTVGAIINLLNWPRFWPGVFDFHEVFHLFVMAGSLAHFQFMLRVLTQPVAGTSDVRTQAVHPAEPFARLPDTGMARGYCQPIYVRVTSPWGRGNGS